MDSIYACQAGSEASNSYPISLRTWTAWSPASHWLQSILVKEFNAASQSESLTLAWPRAISRPSTYACPPSSPRGPKLIASTDSSNAFAVPNDNLSETALSRLSGIEISFHASVADDIPSSKASIIAWADS